tara:strand:- start:1589 stop:2341 length:753 start_codon:yes stop_codon:yes gene_type:complete
MTHIFGDNIDQLDDLFIFAEIGMATSSIRQIDLRHIFNISKPVTGDIITGVPISTANFQKLFYGTPDNSDDGVGFDTEQKATPFSFTSSHVINDSTEGVKLKAYYNLAQDDTIATDKGKYAWSETSSTNSGLHFEEKVISVWLHDMGCMDENNLSTASLVRLKKELHRGEFLNCGSYDIYAYNWGDFETEYEKHTGRTFAADTVAASAPGATTVVTAGSANVALDIMLSNSNPLAKNILLRVSYTVTATG